MAFINNLMEILSIMITKMKPKNSTMYQHIEKQDVVASDKIKDHKTFTLFMKVGVFSLCG
jgi:hypothetical protein